MIFSEADLERATGDFSGKYGRERGLWKSIQRKVETLRRSNKSSQHSKYRNGIQLAL